MRRDDKKSLVSVSWKLWAVAAVAVAGCEPTVQHQNVIFVDSTSATEDSATADSQPAKPVASAETESFYTVAKYDPQRDPTKDLVETVLVAQDSNKRILIQVGGDWCGWCHKLDKYIAEHVAVSQAIHEHFVIMKVNYSDDNKNESFLAQYPTIPGYPHLYVLESDGSLLHSQDTVELEEGSSYSEAALLTFADRWKAN